MTVYEIVEDLDEHTVKWISFSSAKSTSSVILFPRISTTVANSDIASFPGTTKTLKFSAKILANAYSLAELPMINKFFFISEL